MPKNCWYRYIGGVRKIYHGCNLTLHGKSSFGRPPLQYPFLVRSRGRDDRNAYKPQLSYVGKFETADDMASASMVRSIVDARPAIIKNSRFLEQSHPICILKGPCRSLIVILALPTEDGRLRHREIYRRGRRCR
jgi:hypothetical protein